jgi:hypothetical protein
MSVSFGAFTPSTYQDIIQQIRQSWQIYGASYYVDPVNGSDTFAGTSPTAAYKTLPQAYAAAVSGAGDTIYLLSDGTTTGTARLTSTLTIAKNALNIIGACAPSYNPRARISTLSGTSAFAQFVKVTGTGCQFANVSLFNDNAIAAQITWTDQGGRNAYSGVLFGGMGDGTSAHSTSSRCVTLGGSGASGENTFRNCTFGIDTSLTPGRDVANATLEFVGGSKRNVFEDCKFVTSAKATTVLHLKSSGTNPLETFQWFKRCAFHNTYPQSSGSLMASVATLAANGNGNLVLEDSTRWGTTDWGTDSTSLAQIITSGPAAGTGATSGQSVVAVAT